jgi:hypothetical protein
LHSVPHTDGKALRPPTYPIIVIDGEINERHINSMQVPWHWFAFFEYHLNSISIYTSFYIAKSRVLCQWT